MSDKTKEEKEESLFTNGYYNYDPTNTRYDYEDFRGKSLKDDDKPLFNSIYLDWILGNKTRKELRENAYNGIEPEGYSGGGIGALWRTFQGLNYSSDYVQNKILENPDRSSRDDIWRTYLGIPSNQAHEIPQGYLINSVIPSKYKPDNAKENTNYYTLSNIPDSAINALIRIGIGRYNNSLNTLNKGLELGQSRVSKGPGSNDLTGMMQWLGNYWIKRGLDPTKGEYVSFSDLWDIAPLHNREDESRGLGHPISFYDKIYLDDYYGVDSKQLLKEEKKLDKDIYYQGYLPELVIKNKQGGKLIPKKRFTK